MLIGNADVFIDENTSLTNFHNSTIKIVSAFFDTIQIDNCCFTDCQFEIDESIKVTFMFCVFMGNTPENVDFNGCNFHERV